MALYSREDDVAIIAVNNPPMNALSHHVRKDLIKFLKVAEADENVTAIVLCGDGRTFPVGADIKEFHKSVSALGPTIIDIVHALEKSSKPTVAAIHGSALGGGLELALGCHYRIAMSTSKVGLPEVKLGILPGAGGTQRLPRVIGLDNAMKWIAYGHHHPAGVGASLGLIDRIVAKGGDIRRSAILFARSMVGKGLGQRRLSNVSVPDASKVEELMAKHLKEVGLRTRGALAPVVCLQVIKSSALLSYKDGLESERQGMMTLLASSESKAQIYSFFSERQVSKWNAPGIANHATAKPMQVRSIAVVGLGTMGRGIAISSLKAGKKTYVVELNSKALAAGVKYIRGYIETMKKRAQISEEQAAAMQSAIIPVSSYNGIANVDLVIEAVFENMKIKKEIFGKLDKVCKPSTILASNTSTLDIDEIASATKRPEKVAGMHFFAPAHIMLLLENIYGRKSSAETIATIMDIGKQMKKITVLVGNCVGFVGNRMYGYYTTESVFILEEAAYPEQVDKVLTDYGFAMGRFQVGDLSGNDIGYKIRTGLGITHKQQPAGTPERKRGVLRYCPLGDFLVEKGRLGLKVGKGWYKYEGSRTPIPDPEVRKIIDEYRTRHHIVPRDISSEEVLQRMLYPLINEGFKILEEGIAANPWDIDMIYQYGYAWPRHTGGPMYYAFTIGLPQVLKVIEEHWKAAGASEPHWQPSTMLTWLVENHGNPDISQWMPLMQKHKSKT
uniref:Peroxisomal bifunctional enzyme n=1 Tax=Ciona savignyi TaxID=51511 RepID=H2Y777_CIOSA